MCVCTRQISCLDLSVRTWLVRIWFPRCFLHDTQITNHKCFEDPKTVPYLKYIKGENNVIANYLSHLDMSDNQYILNISELYGYDDNDLLDSAYPICYQDISKAQKTYAKLEQRLFSHNNYTLNTFRGGDQNHRLICQNSKIFLPTSLQKKTVDWYHEMLCHPGET